MAVLAGILSLAMAVAVPAAAAPPGGGEVQPLVFVAPGGHEVVPAKDIDQPPEPLQTDIEWPSQDLYRRGQGGTVVLRLVIDARGVPARVSIERSSGMDLLDLSAAVAATQWRFSPAKFKGKAVASEARQPVNFEIPPEYSLARTTGRKRDAWFEQRRAGTAQRPAADAEGRFPGYVPDPFPIGVDSVAQAREMLERHGYRAAPGPVPVIGYALRDEEGYSEWAVLPALPDGVVMLVRNRLVGDAQSSWMVQSFLCEGPQDRCEQIRGRLAKGAPAQVPGGPYPVPPGEAAGTVP